MRPGLSNDQAHNPSATCTDTESPTTSTRTRPSPGGGSRPCSAHTPPAVSNPPSAVDGRVFTHSSPHRMTTVATPAATVPDRAVAGRPTSGNRRAWNGRSTT